jgi:hypothetical protein
MVKAIFARDYILLQGAVRVFALAFVVIPACTNSISRTACSIPDRASGMMLRAAGRRGAGAPPSKERAYR